MPRYRQKDRVPTPDELISMGFILSRHIVVHIECCQECNKEVNCRTVIEMNDRLAELILTKRAPKGDTYATP